MAGVFRGFWFLVLCAFVSSTAQLIGSHAWQIIEMLESATSVLSKRFTERFSAPTADVMHTHLFVAMRPPATSIRYACIVLVALCKPQNHRRRTVVLWSRFIGRERRGLVLRRNGGRVQRKSFVDP